MVDLVGEYPADIAKRRIEQLPSVAPAQTEWAKVIGGKDAEKGQFPWQASLILAVADQGYPFYGHFCGGTLVGWRWVLTAAHCTYVDNVEMAAESIHVYLGSHDFTGGQRIAVKRIIRAEYDPSKQGENDVALLELTAEPRDKTGLKLIQLAGASHDDALRPGRLDRRWLGVDTAGCHTAGTAAVL